MDDLSSNITEDSNDKDNITYLSGLYKEWFLDYASYVILERAVPCLLYTSDAADE